MYGYALWYGKKPLWLGHFITVVLSSAKTCARYLQVHMPVASIWFVIYDGVLLVTKTEYLASLIL